MQKNITSKHFILNDYLWLEEHNAWFTGIGINSIFCYNFLDKKCEFITDLPIWKNRYWREYSRCFKYKSYLYCIPHFGTKLLVYDLNKKKWKEICINNPKSISIICLKFYQINDLLYLISNGLKQIIVVDLKKMVIEGYYNIPIQDIDNMGIGSFDNDFIYIITTNSTMQNIIYKFDCKKRKFKEILLPVIKDELFTISFFNKNYWLTGKCKKIWIFEEDNNKLKVIDKFPDNYGFYNFTKENKDILDYNITNNGQHILSEMILVGNKMWCIPFQTNKIMFIDTLSYNISFLEIKEEEETKETLNNRIFAHKYLIQYTKDDRFIGLYSLKNEYVIEIDAKKLIYEILPVNLTESCIKRYSNFIFSESKKFDIYLYKYFLNEIKMKNKTIGENIGSLVYSCK